MPIKSIACGAGRHQSVLKPLCDSSVRARHSWSGWSMASPVVLPWISLRFSRAPRSQRTCPALPDGQRLTMLVTSRTCGDLPMGVIEQSGSFSATLLRLETSREVFAVSVVA